jgi:predicted dehydrogenase
MAIAGAGGMAAVHAAAAGPAGFRLTAVASDSGRSSRSLAGEADARRVRPEELPAGADVLVVATPAPSHVDLTRRGASAGAAVLVESPWCDDVAAADALAGIDGGTGRVRGAASVRCGPTWSAAARRFASLVRPDHVSGRFVQPAPDWGHLAERHSPDDALVLLGPTALVLVEDASGGTVTEVAAERRDTRTHLRLALDSPAGPLTATLEVGFDERAEVWFQVAAPDGVVRCELAPGRLLEVDGEPVTLAPATGPAAELVEAGYVPQLQHLGGPDDRTVDVATIRRITGALAAAR